MLKHSLLAIFALFSSLSFARIEGLETAKLPCHIKGALKAKVEVGCPTAWEQASLEVTEVWTSQDKTEHFVQIFVDYGIKDMFEEIYASIVEKEVGGEKELHITLEATDNDSCDTNRK